MAVNRIKEGYIKQPKVRFPAEFDALYNKPRAYFGSPIAVREIHYEYEIPAQTYHAEKSKAQHAYDFKTIASKAHFQHTTFREPRPGYVATNPVNNGARPFQVSDSGTRMPLATFPGRLGTFVNNQSHLRGGVLSSVEGQKYARDILDRRANQIRAMEQPEAQAQTNEVLSPLEADKLELTSLLQEVLESVGAGTFTDLVFGSLRKLTQLLLKTLPQLDNDDVENIRLALEEAVESQTAEADFEEHHGSVPGRQGDTTFLDIRRRDAKAGFVLRNLEKLFGFMNELSGADFANRPEKARRTLVRSLAKHWKLGSVSDVAPREVRQPSAPAPSRASSVAPAGLPPPPPDDGGEDSGSDGGGGDEGASASEEEEEESVAPSSASSAPPPKAVSLPKAPPGARASFIALYNSNNIEGLKAFSQQLKLFSPLANLDGRTRTKFKNRFNQKFPGDAV
jgi:hypothetical protein